MMERSSSFWFSLRDLRKSVNWAPAITLSSLNFLPPPKGMIARYLEGSSFIISTRFGWRSMVSCFIESNLGKGNAREGCSRRWEGVGRSPSMAGHLEDGVLVPEEGKSCHVSWIIWESEALICREVGTLGSVSVCLVYHSGIVSTIRERAAHSIRHGRAAVRGHSVPPSTYPQTHSCKSS